MSLFPIKRVIQGHVFVIREAMPEQGGLALLARPGHGNAVGRCKQAFKAYFNVAGM